MEGRGHSHLGSAKTGCSEGAVSIKSRLPVRQDKREVGDTLENSDNHKGEKSGSEYLLLHRWASFLTSDLNSLSALCLTVGLWSESEKSQR